MSKLINTGNNFYNEKKHEDFITREEFINRTGIFVTPQHFDYIYDCEWKDAKEAGKSLEDFLNDYDKIAVGLEEIELKGTFKYLVMDDEISCLGMYDDLYSPNIWEIMNCLAMTAAESEEYKRKMINVYKKELKDIICQIQTSQLLQAEPTILN